MPTNDKAYDIIHSWATDAEDQLRLHAGVPNGYRSEANAIVHNAILNCLQEMIAREDFDDLIADLRVPT